jgi:hypothetical protein
MKLKVLAMLLLFTVLRDLDGNYSRRRLLLHHLSWMHFICNSAPCLVAISLIEAGMPQLDAVAYIRKRRRGAINAKQISYIEKYQRRGPRGCCVIL